MTVSSLSDPHICPTPCPADDHWWHPAAGLIASYEQTKAREATVLVASAQQRRFTFRCMTCGLEYVSDGHAKPCGKCGWNSNQECVRQ